MNKEDRDAWWETWIPLSTIILVFLLMWLTAILSGCTSGDRVETLEKKVEHQQQIIDAYEEFRTIAVKVYVNQVDSTGDGFDESDDGLDFWLSCQKIDDITHKKQTQLVGIHWFVRIGVFKNP